MSTLDAHAGEPLVPTAVERRDCGPHEVVQQAICPLTRPGALP